MLGFQQMIISFYGVSMKTALVLLAVMTLSTASFADEAATLTCTGANVILTETLSNKGDSIYTLSSKTNKQLAPAVFANAEYESEQFGNTYITAKARKGNHFTLNMNFVKNQGEAEISKGHLDYQGNSLAGGEAVICVRK